MILKELPLIETAILHPLVKEIIGGKNIPLNLQKDNIDSIFDKVSKRNFPISNRITLVKELKNQYKNFFFDQDISTQSALIQSLESSNCFTVTTGHQLCLFGGPFYFIYKIASAIKLANELNHRALEMNKEHPLKFIPMFWMASEDHDFEEISTVHLYNKAITWNRDSKGPVGRLSLEGVEELILEIESIFTNAAQKELISNLLRNAYLSQGVQNLSMATARMVFELFKNTDLLIIDADNKAFKTEFIPYIKLELEQNIGHKEVSLQTEIIGKEFSMPISPREINLFEISDISRTRILNENKENFLKNLEQFPETISPNVVLRPVFQEVILPNVAYIGGTNEIAYWYQLPSLFKALNVPFPALLVRSSTVWMTEKQNKEIEKLKLNIQDIFTAKDLNGLISIFYEKNEIELSIEKIYEAISFQLQKVKSATQELDSSFGAMITKKSNELLSEVKKSQKEIKGYIEKSQEDSISKLSKLYDQIFPNGRLQERRDNFLSIYSIKGQAMIDELVQDLNPLNESLYVLKK